MREIELRRGRMDRDFLEFERAVRRTLQVLEGRDTKSVGTEYSARIQSFLRHLNFRFSRYLHPEARNALYRIQKTRPRASRTSAIQSLYDMLEVVSRSRAEFSERRTRALEHEIEELQAQVGQLSSELDDKTPEEAEGPAQPNVAADSAVFVIMPFGGGFDDVWQGGIRRASEEEGFTPIRIDEINKSSNITDDIIDAIRACQIAIVDVTDNNPNVMFELGYTLAEKKPHIIISQSTDFLPFDIRNIRTIEYTNSWSGIEALRAQLAEYLKEHKATKKPKTKAKPTRKKRAAKKKSTST